MARKIGYYKSYNQTPDRPISVAPEIYVGFSGDITSAWYLITNTEHGDVSLDFKELVALRDALTAAIDDADAAIAREVASMNKAKAAYEKRKNEEAK